MTIHITSNTVTRHVRNFIRENDPILLDITKADWVEDACAHFGVKSPPFGSAKQLLEGAWEMVLEAQEDRRTESADAAPAALPPAEHIDQLIKATAPTDAPPPEHTPAPINSEFEDSAEEAAAAAEETNIVAKARAMFKGAAKNHLFVQVQLQVLAAQLAKRAAGRDGRYGKTDGSTAKHWAAAIVELLAIAQDVGEYVYRPGKHSPTGNEMTPGTIVRLADKAQLAYEDILGVDAVLQTFTVVRYAAGQVVVKAPDGCALVLARKDIETKGV